METNSENSNFKVRFFILSELDVKNISRPTIKEILKPNLIKFFC